MEISLRIAADLQQIKQVRDLLRRCLPAMGLRPNLIDDVQLVISEALNNVILHAKPTASEIEIVARATGDSINFVVSDNGGGFPEFSDVMNNRMELPELPECGMGLSIIAMLSNDIWYSLGDDSHGNRLGFSFPRKHRPSILLIDDDLIQLELLKSYAEPEYDVFCASGGVEALTLLKQRRVDIVVSDIHMPGLNGIDMRQRLLGIEHSRLTPFVFMTGNNDERQRTELVVLGIDDYLVKPIDKSAFLATIYRILRKNEQLIELYGDKLDTTISQRLKGPIHAEKGGFRIATFSDSATVGGGDFYFEQSLDFRRIWLGDVMGHGEQAKFFAHAYAAAIRGALEAESWACSSERAMQSVSNRLYQHELLNHSIVTLALVDLFAQGRASIVMAGHPPPIYIRGGCVKTLQVGGMLPGLQPDMRYESVELNMEPGDMLLFYSDGLEDPSCNNVLANKVVQALAKLNETGKGGAIFTHESQSMGEQLVSELIDQFGLNRAGSLQDDATLIVVERVTG